MNLHYERDPDSIIRMAIHNATYNVVKATDGDDGFEERPWLPGSETIETRPKPMAAIKALRTITAEARMRMWGAVRDARGAGATWADIAAALDVDTDGQPPAEAAFEQAAGGRSDRWSRPAVYWTCRTCEQTVVDHGPYEFHPRDNESGHAADCARFLAEIAAREKDLGQD